MDKFGDSIIKIAETELYRVGTVLPESRISEVVANPSSQITEIIEGLGIMDRLKDCWNWIKGIVNKIMDMTSRWMSSVQIDAKLAPFYHLSIYEVTIVSILYVIAKHYGDRVATKVYKMVLPELTKNAPK
jgi:ferritin-like metal-binding protein YciE